MNKLLLLTLTLLFTVGCFKEKGAQETLRAYIEGRFQGSLDRLEVSEFLSGHLKKNILEMSDEDFEKYSNLSNLKKKKFKVTYESCSLDKCFITYLISYDQLKDSKDFFRVDSKKIAEMTKIEDEWKIEKVTNVKSYLESKEPLNIEN
jgi:hypothetical protein